MNKLWDSRLGLEEDLLRLDEVGRVEAIAIDA